MTPELDKLRAAWGDLEGIVMAIELELVDDPDWPEPSDTSYLKERDRANHDVMASVEAMAQVNAMIAWLGRDHEGWVGLWRGPDGTPVDVAPVVRLDTEGQYEIVGATLGDYLATSLGLETGEFERARPALVRAGLVVTATEAEAWAKLDTIESPKPVHLRLYNEARVRRGLPPFVPR